jgi:hypothetical protein
VLPNARWIRIADNTEELRENRRGEVELYAHPGLALRRSPTSWASAVPSTSSGRRQCAASTCAARPSMRRSSRTRRRQRRPHASESHLRRAARGAEADAITIADGGDILSFARLGLEAPRTYLDAGTFGCLGVGTPYGVAAALLNPGRQVVVISGDGAFGINAMEIDSAKRHGAKVVFIIANNAAWNIERLDQQMNYGGRIVGTTLAWSNYAGMAKAFDLHAERVTDPARLKGALEEASSTHPRSSMSSSRRMRFPPTPARASAGCRATRRSPRGTTPKGRGGRETRPQSGRDRRRACAAHAAEDRHARLAPTLTYAQWNSRACKLANALLALGLKKGDRVALLAYNRVEWMEIYIALAKAGLVAVPINFDSCTPEIKYIVEHSQARALIVQDELAPQVEGLRGALPIPDNAWIRIGDSTAKDWTAYEALIERAADGEPKVEVKPADTWALMYTSGTTGKPKGAIRNHEGMALISLVTALDMGLTRDDTALLVMPMCHANSLNFGSTFTYIGATIVVDDRKSFDPEALLATIAAQRITFTSLVPTHYIMALGLPDTVKSSYDVSRIRKLMISSAPARKDTKLAILDYFKNSQLYELYGSSEAGWVTLLRPDEQIEHLGSVGREWTGSGPGEDSRSGRQRSSRRRGRRALLVHAVHVRRLPQRSGEDEGVASRRRLLQRRRLGAPRRARASSTSSTARAT